MNGRCDKLGASINVRVCPCVCGSMNNMCQCIISMPQGCLQLIGSCSSVDTAAEF